MSNIDEIIARSRQPGKFGERRSFSVARERAIQKMRQFALADPHYYVLELIQAAIANQATHVDLQIEDDTFIMSYVGGGFSEGELSQIFDFLFASKSDVSTGALRQLALGINALMRFKPERIIIESGNGTLAGTTRVELDHRRNKVEVGTPEAPLNGTFLRAQRLRRLHLTFQSSLKATDYGPPECAAIEDRCLSAPVPILVNSQPVFGYASVKIPQLYGFDHVTELDEGDLYGAIGVARLPHNQHFKLLTWGVWVQSVEFSLIEGQGFGGVITFNQLNKTADHAAIVKDERFAALIARLRPYVRMALSGTSGKKAFQVGLLGGEPLTPAQLREVINANKLLVTTDANVDATHTEGTRALQIGEALDAPVLRVSDADFKTFIDLVGTHAQVLRPDLETLEDLRLLNGPVATAPPRPWLLGPVKIDPIETYPLIDQLRDDAPPGSLNGGNIANTRLFERLGGAHATMNATIFTPLNARENAGDAGKDVWARIHVAERVVWQGAVDCAYPGHVLDIYVQAQSPGALLAANPFDKSQKLAEAIAQTVTNLARDKFEEASARALARLQKDQIRPGTSGARIALAALARDLIMELRPPEPGETSAQIQFTLLNETGEIDLLDLQLLETVNGRHISFRDLESMMRHTHGLVYGTIPQVPANLDGLDRSRILALDLQSEALLTEIVGHGAYIRVDSRDVLAESDDGRWQVRDLAIGLREYPEGALLLEGEAARAGETPDENLIATLVSRLKITRLADSGGALSRQEDEEARRQATRHLRYFVCRRRKSRPDLPAYGVDHLGLFLDAQRREVSLAQIIVGYQTHGALMMLDGRATDSANPSLFYDKTVIPQALLLNLWSYYLLRSLVPLAGAFDLTAQTIEPGAVAPDNPDNPEISDNWRDEDIWIVTRDLDSSLFKGRIGLSTAVTNTPTIRVISPTKRRAFIMRQSAITAGIAGLIQLKQTPPGGQIDLTPVEHALREASVLLLHDALDQLPELEKAGHLPATLRALLDFASRHIQLVEADDRPIEPRTVGTRNERALARRIMKAPFFPTRQGVPVGAIRLLRQACLERYRGEKIDADARIELSEDIPEPQKSWFEHLTRMPTVRPPHTPLLFFMHKQSAGTSELSADFTRRVEQLLHRLRPDLLDALPTRVQLFDRERPDFGLPGASWPIRALIKQSDEKTPVLYFHDETPTLLLDQNHPLIHRAINAPPGDDAPMAWLLLAAYAHINALLEPVTNDHELTFQRRVLDALQAGEIHVG